jgi:hypothetical protein
LNVPAGKTRNRVLAITSLLAMWCQITHAATPVVEIEIKDHLFFPAEVVLPANTKVKLMISNLDPTPEEFESYELNREKVINGNSKTTIFIGPLPAGEYPFFGEFFPRTAQGRVVVE